MAFELKLPTLLKSNGWKVKIRDKEVAEEPHVTIINKKKWWRYSIRNHDFMDNNPPPADVPSDILQEITSNLQVLEDEWNNLYPYNRVK